MYPLIKNAHNIIGMVVLLVLSIVLIITLIRFLSKKPFDKFSKITSLIGLITVHLQLIFGWLVYFISPLGMSNFSSTAMKGTVSRFFIIEHPLGMIIAAVLITMGYKRIKKDKYSDTKKYKQVLVFYGIGLAIITYLIPWFVWK